MFCLLCRKHNLSNKFNKSKTKFNIEPSVRYRKPTLLEHVSNSIVMQLLQSIFSESPTATKKLLTLKRQPIAFCSKFSLLFTG